MKETHRTLSQAALAQGHTLARKPDTGDQLSHHPQADIETCGAYLGTAVHVACTDFQPMLPFLIASSCQACKMWELQAPYSSICSYAKLYAPVCRSVPYAYSCIYRYFPTLLISYSTAMQRY